MSKRQSAAEASRPGSPYLSFREAVRPAIFAHRLADSGESGIADELRRRLEGAVRDKYKKPLSAIHGHMKPAAIESALETLTEALSEIPQSKTRDTWLRSFLPALARSTQAQLNLQNTGYDDGLMDDVYMLGVGGSVADLAADIFHIAAEFRSLER